MIQAPVADGEGGKGGKGGRGRGGRGRGGRGRGRGGPWPRWDGLADSFWVHDEARDMLGIHCAWHPNCRLNRSLNEGKKNKNQGRPVGFLQAWEEAGGKPGIRTQQDHINLSYHPDRLQFTRAVRRAARDRVKATPSCAGVIGLEFRRPGDDSEPEGFP